MREKWILWGLEGRQYISANNWTKFFGSPAEITEERLMLLSQTLLEITHRYK